VRRLSIVPARTSSAPVPLMVRVAAAAPRFFPGAMLHHAALWMAAGSSPEKADRLFEAAARRYREELRIEPLARLRVHQQMLAARTPRIGEADPALEVERRLLALDRIESPVPPFALVDARTLAGVWRHRLGGGSALAREHPPAPLRAAA